MEDTTEAVILLPDFSTTQVIQVFSLLCGIQPSADREDCDESLQDLCSLLLVPMKPKDDTNPKDGTLGKWKMEIEKLFSYQETKLKYEVTSENYCVDN